MEVVGSIPGLCLRPVQVLSETANPTPAPQAVSSVSERLQDQMVHLYSVNVTVAGGMHTWNGFKTPMQPFYHLQSIKNVFLMERLTETFHQNSFGRLCLEKKTKKT